MGRRVMSVTAWALVVGVCLHSSIVRASTTLSKEEQDALIARIQRFETHPEDPAVMQQVPPKYSVDEQKFVHPNPQLHASEELSDPLLRAAQLKGTLEYQVRYCEEVLRKKFPEIECEKPEGMRATIEANDRVEKLVGTWMSQSDLALDLDGLPTRGEAVTGIWSDDYWRTKYGQTSYRYSERRGFDKYEAAVGSYSQPGEWMSASGRLSPPELTAAIVPWSPAEKYDLTLGDETFMLTRQQKAEGKRFKTPNGDVEDWMGLCHGWSAASVMVPPPKNAVAIPGPRGASITWYPYDIRAMATLAWANGNTYNNFIGGRCNTRKPSTFGNGRLRQQECFDTNPATFHLALGNLIGKAKQSFNMDSSFDYEVWNQPIKSYEFNYCRPGECGDPAKWTKNWKEAAVDYNDAFKARDRFQSPLTRGQRMENGWDDRGIRQIVGVVATVVYLVETIPAPHVSEALNDPSERVTYFYDLELHDVGGGKLAPRGGEWAENTHPDFLWVPRKDTYTRTSFDFINLNYNGTTALNGDATETAQAASQYGYPLCQVLKVLVAKSSGVDGVRCPRPR